MPENVKKHPNNVPGRYYVDCEACAAHFLCVDLAPGTFRSDEGGEHRWEPYVFKQPETPDEEKRCRTRVFRVAAQVPDALEFRGGRHFEIIRRKCQDQGSDDLLFRRFER